MKASKISAGLLAGNRLLLWLISFIVFAGMASVWAISSPLSSVPDEPAHIVKAAGVVRGQPFGERAVSPDGHAFWTYKVPEAYAEVRNLSCNAFRSFEPVTGCEIVIDAPEGSLFDADSGAGGYNPTYYYLVGWPSLVLPNLQGILAMRLVSGLLAAAFFASAVWATSWLRRRALPIISIFLTATPSVLFYAGGVNPQGLEVSTLAAFTAAYFVALQTRARGRLLWSLATIMMIAGALGAQTRNLAWVWLGAIVLVGMVWVGIRRWGRFVWRLPVVIAVIAVIAAIVVNLAILFALSSLQGGGEFWGAGISAANGFVFMLWRFTEFFTSMFALFGWMDVDGGWAVLIYIAVTASLIAAALLARARVRSRIALLTALAVWWMLPALVQAMTVTQFGFIWQGRYSLPLWVLTMFVAALTLAPAFERAAIWLKWRLVITAACAIAFAQVSALVANLHRQYYGLHEPLSYLLSFRGASDLSFDLPPIVGPAGWILIMSMFATLLALLICSAGRPGLQETERTVSATRL